MRLIPIVAATLTFAAALPACAQSADDSPAAPAAIAAHVAAVDSALRAAADRGMAGVFRLEADDSVLLHRAYGLRDREGRSPMTVETGFDIGSLVKPVTGVAVLKLVEQGRLSPGDSVGRFFPQAPPPKRGVTIQQLLTHTGGFDDFIGDDYELVDRATALDRILRQPLVFEPGTDEQYSNSAYTLLAMIIEDVTGQSYERFLSDEILAPAGAQGISYVMPPWPNDRLAVGYTPGGDRWGTPLDQPWLDDGVSWTFRGAGGMLGTAEQMARWYKGLFDGRVLGDDALAHFYSYAAGESPSVGGRALGHAGGNGVFNTLHVSWIEHDVHMTFFTSTGGDLRAEGVWDQISEHVIGIARATRDAAPEPAS